MWLHYFIIWLFDIVRSFPQIILALAIVAVLGPSLLNETFEKCFPLERDSSSRAILQDSRIGQLPNCPLGRGTWTSRVNAKILTTGIH